MLMDFQCLLVKGWKGASWSFPRGKKNKDEEDHTCAVREVSSLITAFTIAFSGCYYFSC